MADIQSFPPIAAADARILILGSIPGQASLQANQYYAHPRNQFWSIMAELLTVAAPSDYTDRVAMLQKAGIALWDVMQSCYRPGSLDAAIAKDSIVANDFRAFFRLHPKISHVYFNGAAAEQSFKRLVEPNLTGQTLTLQRLPSTSPAHAALSYRQKLDCWQQIADQLTTTRP